MDEDHQHPHQTNERNQGGRTESSIYIGYEAPTKMTKKNTVSTQRGLVLRFLRLRACVFSIPWKKERKWNGFGTNDGSPYEVSSLEHKDKPRMLISWDSLFLSFSDSFSPIWGISSSLYLFLSCMQLWSLWLEKLWETQSRVILLWRDLYQNK